MQALQTVDPFGIKEDWSIDDLDIEIAGFTHAVLPQLSFLSRYVPRGPLAALRQAYVRDAGVKDIPSNPAMLEDHPLLLRSFATEIPTDMIELGLGDGQIRSRVPSCNPSGVTVLDVVLSIYAECVSLLSTLSAHDSMPRRASIDWTCRSRTRMCGTLSKTTRSILPTPQRRNPAKSLAISALYAPCTIHGEYTHI